MRHQLRFTWVTGPPAVERLRGLLQAAAEAEESTVHMEMLADPEIPSTRMAAARSRPRPTVRTFAADRCFNPGRCRVGRSETAAVNSGGVSPRGRDFPAVDHLGEVYEAVDPIAEHPDVLSRPASG